MCATGYLPEQSDGHLGVGASEVSDDVLCHLLALAIGIDGILGKSNTLRRAAEDKGEQLQIW